jgi:O-antigen ligase
MTAREQESSSTAGETGRYTLGFWLYALHLVTVWGIALSNGFLALVGLWCLRYWRRLRSNWSTRFRILTPLVLYALFLAISVLTSKDPAVSVPELKELLSLATLPLGLLLVRSERSTRRVFELIVVMTTLLSVFGILQFLLTDYGPIENRIRGPFSHYMTFSGVLLVGGFLLLSEIITRADRRRLVDWLMLTATFVAILLTLTRGVWIAAAVTGFLALVFFAPKAVKLYLGGGAVATLLLFVLIPGPWVGRMRSIVDPRDPSNYDRLCMAEAGLMMIYERPLFGIGPRMVKELYPIYRNPTAPRITVGHLHSTFVDLAAERGLLSLAAYGWLMVLAGAAAVRGYRSGRAADLHLGVLLAIVAFNVGGLFEANWRDTEVQRLLLFLLAVPFILEHAEDESTKDPEPAES